MEETKWLTKGKIIAIICIVLVTIGVISGIFIRRNILKKDYIKFENSLEYAAPNYLLKEKITLMEGEWREINITDILKQKLVINKRASDCKGYVVAEALKDENVKIEENTNDDILEEVKEDNQTKNKKDEKKISNNIRYNAYITCKKIYTTKDYGKKLSNNTKNDDKTQSEDDTEKPSIELFGDKIVTLKIGDKYEEQGAIAMDNVDGDITSKIKITGKVDTSKKGEYTIKYTVKDSSNNKASVSRKIIVEEKKDEEKPEEKPSSENNNNNNNNNNDNPPVIVKDTIAPIITFNDNSLYQTICSGNSVNISQNGPYGFVARDNVDGNITSRVSISGNTGVINTPGVYKLRYSVSDRAGNNVSVEKQFTVKNCSSNMPNTSTKVSVSSIGLTPNNKNMNVGSTISLTLTINPSNATDKTVTFNSSNPSVATVSESGVVTARTRGTTQIIAKSSNGRTAVCNITVN